MYNFCNEATGEHAVISTYEEFERWSAEMDIYDILVQDRGGVWWYYTEASFRLGIM